MEVAREAFIGKDMASWILQLFSEICSGDEVDDGYRLSGLSFPVAVGAHYTQDTHLERKRTLPCPTSTQEKRNIYSCLIIVGYLLVVCVCHRC